MPALYIVGTPIGNLEDMSFRAIRVLKEVSLVASEDTRTTRHLFSHYDIHTPITSYFEHNETAKLDYILEKLKTSDVALISEAGMPGISDPGYELIAAARQAGITVIPVPGPSAAVTALAVSGLPTDRFYYLGFFPRKANARRSKIAEARNQTATLIAYEAPHRLKDALHDIISVLGNRQIAVCRELTKVHEEVFRGTIEEALAHFEEPRGEFTLVIAGCDRPGEQLTPEDIMKIMDDLHQAGTSAREAIAELAGRSGLPRKELYKIWLSDKQADQ